MYEIKDRIINYKLERRRKKIIKILIKSRHLSYKWLIIELINDGYLDNHIDKLADDIVITNVNSFFKKGYLTTTEHFLCVIDNFIHYFLDHFNNVDLLKKTLSFCVENDIGNILLSNNYLYNNDFLGKYIYNYNLMIIGNFYYNALDFKEELGDLFDDIGLDIDNVDITDEDCVNDLMNLMENLCFVNRDRYLILSLFCRPDSSKREHFIDYWELLITNYIKKKDYIL